MGLILTADLVSGRRKRLFWLRNTTDNHLVATMNSSSMETAAFRRVLYAHPNATKTRIVLLICSLANLDHTRRLVVKPMGLLGPRVVLWCVTILVQTNVPMV